MISEGDLPQAVFYCPFIQILWNRMMLMPQPIDVPSLQFITSANALLLYPNGMN